MKYITKNPMVRYHFVYINRMRWNASIQLRSVYTERGLAVFSKKTN